MTIRYGLGLWILVFLMACDSQPQSAVKEKGSAESMQGQKESTLKLKEQYGQIVSSKLEKLAGNIAALKTRAGDMTGKAKADLEAGITALEAKAQDLRRRLGDLKSTSAMQWEIIRADIESRLKNLEETFAQVAANFSA